MDWSRKLVMGAAPLLLSAGMAAQVQAQQQPRQTNQRMEQTATDDAGRPRFQRAQQNAQADSAELRHANKLIGHKVRSAQGEDLGEIRDIVVDAEEGRIAYGVLSFGGFLGMGDKYFAVPWEALQVMGENGDMKIVLDVPKDRLKNAQGFDKDNWPNFADETLLVESYRFYEIEPDQQWSREQGVQASRRLSQRPDMQTGWASDSEYSRKYDPKQAQQFRGTIQRVETFKPDAKAAAGTQIEILTQDNQMRTVQVGPQLFLEGQNVRLQPGQRVTINAAKAKVDGQEVFLAQSVTLADGWRIQLRNEQGTPLWGEQQDMQQQDQPMGEQGAMRPNGMQQQDAMQQDQQEPMGMTYRAAVVEVTQQPFWVNRLSRLNGLDVRNYQNRDLGDLEDVIIDVKGGQIIYAVVSHGGTLGIGEEYALVPWSAIEIRPESKALLIDTDRQTFDRISFRSGAWPDLEDQQYALFIHEQFNQQPYWETLGYAGGMGDSAWAEDSAYNQKYDPQKQQRIQGTIESIGTFYPGRGAQTGVRLRVRTNQNQTVTVHAGPEFFLRENNFELKNGDQILVDGAPANVDRRSVLLARQITTSEGEALELRNEQGQPKWRVQQQWGAEQGRRMGKQEQQPGRRMGQQEPAPGQRIGQMQEQQRAWAADSEYNRKFNARQTREIRGQIEEIQTFRPDQQAAEGTAVQIRTQDNQTFTVQIAPSQFLQQQNVQMLRGQQLTIRGSQARVNGQNVILAQRITLANGRRIELRDQQGTPRWDAQQLQREQQQNRQRR